MRAKEGTVASEPPLDINDHIFGEEAFGGFTLLKQ